MPAKIKTFDYLRTLKDLEKEIMEAVRKVLRSGHLMLGPETEGFEREFAEFVGARHCIGVSSGTTALHLALTALRIGRGADVLTVPNTCAPTIAAIRLTGADPRFTDVSNLDLMMDTRQAAERITGRTRCILPVHLWGQSVDLKGLAPLSGERGIAVVEDCAQACGTRYHGRHVGTFGVAGCFSFYPTKNLGAYGDAGAVITDRDDLADLMRRLRTYGYDEKGRVIHDGMNARISEIQAAILRVKLSRLPGWLARRRAIADAYDDQIKNPDIRTPFRHRHVEHAFHQYVIRCKDRDKVTGRLDRHGIGWGVHYPIPVHRMPAYVRFAPDPLPVAEQAANELLSIPMHEGLTDAEVERVTEVLNG